MHSPEESSTRIEVTLTRIETKLDIALAIKAKDKARKQQMVIDTLAGFITVVAVGLIASAIEHRQDIINWMLESWK